MAQDRWLAHNKAYLCPGTKPCDPVISNIKNLIQCHMERWQGRVALVTGASTGIGAAIAKTLVQRGMKVVGCARSIDNLEVSYYDLETDCVLV